jgi:hypothetical protein
MTKNMTKNMTSQHDKILPAVRGKVVWLCIHSLSLQTLPPPHIRVAPSFYEYLVLIVFDDRDDGRLIRV